MLKQLFFKKQFLVFHGSIIGKVTLLRVQYLFLDTVILRKH